MFCFMNVTIIYAFTTDPSTVCFMQILALINSRIFGILILLNRQNLTQESSLFL